MLSERAVAFVVEAAAAPQPYFLSLHYTAPHWPWSSPSVEAAARQREVDRADAHLWRDDADPRCRHRTGYRRGAAQPRRARDVHHFHQRQWRRAFFQDLAIRRPPI